MAQLSTIIGSILRDMVWAQHQANLYAMTLSESYKKNGKTEKFPLPGVVLGDIDLQLHYAVEDNHSEDEQYEIDYREFRKMSRDMATELSNAIVRTAFSALDTSESTDYSSKVSGGRLVAELSRESDLYRKYSAFLSRKIFKTIQKDIASLLLDNGRIDEEKLLQTIVRAYDRSLLKNEEVAGLFIQGGNESRVHDEVCNAVKQIIADLLRERNFLRKRVMPSMAVTVEAEELSKLPEECINTVHIKVNPRNMALFYDEPESE